MGLIAGLMLGPPALAWGQDVPPPAETPPRPGAPTSPGTSGTEPPGPPPVQGTGGAGQQPAPESDSEAPRGETKALSARVLGVSPGILYVEDDSGAAIPLRVTHATRVEGRRIPREQAIDGFLRKEFKPGASVRATFDVRTHADGMRENVAGTVDSP